MARRGEKENAVYEAVLRLMARGEQLHTVTVQQIAQEAGIGKGTVYEYFTSREEILTKTFLRRVEQEVQALAARVDLAQDFDGKLESLLDVAREMMRAQPSCIKLLLSDADAAGIVEKLCGGLCESGAHAVEQLCAMIGRVIAAGVREGVLPAPPGETCGLMAVAGGVFGYVNACRFLPGQSDESLRAEAKRMIYRALGAEAGTPCA
ncbi:MAG: TetR/AcrR family transcriptional regulator [Subdoligranulum sp.]|nr:TetR/AcrR family transcriptional regulator [Subdoligranulum sp.]